MSERRIDPEPITIYLAIVATFTASVSAANYIKTHYKTLPAVAHKNISRSLAELEDHVRYLRADVEIIRNIFSRAQFPNGRAIRLGSGAHLTEAEFGRFMKTSQSVIRRLADVQELALKMERETTKMPGLQQLPFTNALGAAYEQLESLLSSRDLSVNSAWEQMQSIAESVEKAIRELRRQLGG